MVNSTTFAPNVWKMVIGGLQVLRQVLVPGRLPDVHPLPVEQVVAHLPAAQAQRHHLGVLLGDQEGPPRPASPSQPWVAGPGDPSVSTSSAGSRSQPTVASSTTLTPYAGRAWTERPMPSVMAMESPTIRRRTGRGP